MHAVLPSEVAGSSELAILTRRSDGYTEKGCAAVKSASFPKTLTPRISALIGISASARIAGSLFAEQAIDARPPDAEPASNRRGAELLLVAQP